MINRRLQARPVSSPPNNQILREGVGSGRSNPILDHGHKCSLKNVPAAEVSSR
jgi:hypothetical protein